MYKDIISNISKKQFAPIYFLMGDEPYFIDKITDKLMKEVLTPDEQTFNQVVLYGKDVDAGVIINNAKRYPMMSRHQLVVVKEAQHVKNIDDLVYYAQNPLKSTILVVNYKYKKLDKRKKLYKELEKNGVLFESQKLYDNQVPAWITQYLKELDVKIEPPATLLLTEYLGNDLAKISNELTKLLLVHTDKSKPVNADIIEKSIGISKDFNNFELQNALQQKNAYKANQIILYFEKNPNQNPITLTITSLYFFFSKVLMYHFLKDKSQKNVAATLKVNPFFIKDYQLAAKNYNAKKVVDIIHLLREYDLKSKGSGNVSTSHGDLLKELIFRVLN